MRFSDDSKRSKRAGSRSRGSQNVDTTCDGDNLAALSRTRRHWYDDSELEIEQADYELAVSNSRVNQARRRLERYLDHIKLKNDLEDVLDSDFDDDWSAARRQRKRRRARRMPPVET